MIDKMHLRDAFRWNGTEPIGWDVMLAAGLGMAAPVLLAAWAGRLPLGLAAAVGSLMVSGAVAQGSWRDQARHQAGALFLAIIVAGTATMIAGPLWRTDAATILLAISAATLGGYSRGFAMASGRFIVLLIIVVNVAGGGFSLMGAGALWTSLLAFVLARFVPEGERRAVPLEPPARAATPAQKFRRWKRFVGELAGWQFALRLALCLGVASAIHLAWPEHHFAWIAMTVAILCQRQLEPAPLRTTQRALGALFGVALTGLAVGFTLPSWALVAGVGLLAAIRPWLRARNYLAYSAAMTPLLILLLDAGKPVDGGVLVDRLIATLIGAALVIAANQLFVRLLKRGD